MATRSITRNCTDGWLAFGPHATVLITPRKGPRGGRNGWQANVVAIDGRSFLSHQRAPLTNARLLKTVAESAIAFAWGDHLSEPTTEG